MGTFSIILTAGGIGQRMGAEIPKQFLEIAGKPILLHTLERFYSFDPSAQIIITLPSDQEKFWQKIFEKHVCSIPHQVIIGGKERYHSIKNALQFCTGEFVAIHDGVRPLVSKGTWERCTNAVDKYGQVIPAIPIRESIRQIFDDASRAVNRAEYCIVQTPQCFKKDVIQRAYENPYHSGITDDAGLVEELGMQIHLVEGNEENIKITTPYDLKIAAYLLKQLT
jgi:2-C-methyl-D-erythritol 4-phosphate cytidylyltransferase